MFSLNDDTLEEGGESILASEGDLGQLLFPASSGLSNLGRTLASLQTEAEQFYKFPRAEKPVVKPENSPWRTEKRNVQTSIRSHQNMQG